MTARGRFIVLEGIDGSGTTTQSARLTEELRNRGTRVVRTWEPTPGPIGKLIRQALQYKLADDEGTQHTLSWSTMALLFAADRGDHLDSVVKPALAAGCTIVCDRYDLSSLAYQSVTSNGGGDVVPWIRQLNAYALRPDLTVVIDVSHETAAERRAARGGPQELFEVAEIQRRLADVYARAEELVPGDALVHVRDGTPDEVAANILAAVLR